MRSKGIFFISVYLLSLHFTAIKAQEDNTSLQTDIYGYIEISPFFDSRQVVTARQGLVLLYPMNEDLDPGGSDLNGVSGLNFPVINSRMGINFGGPAILGADASARFEVDFLGTRGDLFGMLRLRHAFITLEWEKTSIIAGQTWHPMFVPQCFPNTVSFAGGVPFHALNRAPQIRFTYNDGGLSLSAIALTHSDFPSLGPLGPSGSYLSNSGIPETLLQVLYTNGPVLVGGTAGYQLLRPRTFTGEGYRTDEKMAGIEANIFTTLSLSPATVKIQANYGQNNSHLVMMGGYGETVPLNAEEGIYGYTGIHALSAWTDIETTGSPVKAGLFAGYSRNLGSDEAITGEVWARASDIAQMYRVSPRIIYAPGQVSFGAELVYNITAFGEPDNRFRFTETNNVTNIRALISMKYSF